MASLPFEKWEGLGNDFILVSDTHLSVEDARRVAPSWCDRRFGVGADGILVVGRTPGSMVVINSDGSRPEMCGNGIRCVAAYLMSHGASDAREVVADSGPRSIRVHDGTAEFADVEVDMGIPSADVREAGVSPEHAEPTASELSTVYSEVVDADGYVVSVGNPHWIFIGDEPRDVTEFGPLLEHDPRFANRTNVEWVTRLAANHFRVDVWERGSGRTLACGTGATAVGFALRSLNAIDRESPITITLPGGDLHITVCEDGRSWMRGPARKVYDGVMSERLCEPVRRALGSRARVARS